MSPIAATITDQWDDGKRIHVVGSLVFSGAYVTGGTAFDPVSAPVVTAGSAVKTSKQPTFVQICGIAGFVYSYNPSSKKVMVYTNTTGAADNALGEHTSTTVSTLVSGDTIRFYAVYPRG